MRAFSIINASHARQVIAARDEDQALRIAKRIGFIHTKPKRMDEVTRGAPSGRNIAPEVLEGERSGPMGCTNPDSRRGERWVWTINPYWKEGSQ